MKKNKIILILLLLTSIFISKNINAQTLYSKVKYSGSIGSNPIVLNFLVPDHFYNYIQGNYYYTKYKKKIEFRGEDEVFQGEIKLTESVKGKNTGYFLFDNLDGIDFPKKLIGKWYTMDRKKSYDVILYLQ
jgi:hypothetical protein